MNSGDVSHALQARNDSYIDDLMNIRSVIYKKIVECKISGRSGSVHN